MNRTRHTWKRLSLSLGGLVVLAILPSALASPPELNPLRQTTITILNPEDFQGTVGEDDEYATLVWGDPWDMSDPLDVRQLDSPKCGPYPNHFEDYSPCPDGIWCGEVVWSPASGPDLFLLHPGYPNALAVGRMGPLRPINADQYTQLTFRMYVDSINGGDPGWQVLWTDGSVAEINPFDYPDRYGETHTFEAYPGWNIYTVDLSLYKTGTPPYATGTRPWSGLLTGLRLDPGQSDMTGRIVKLDWVRLTPPQSHPIRWTTNEVGDITIKLESPDGIGADDELRMYEIVSDHSQPVPIPAPRGCYTMPHSLPPGSWSVKLLAGSAESDPAGPLQIQAAPIIRFVTPSRTSGQDYADSELNDPWDMNNPGDVYEWANIAAPTFSGGILSATSIDTNPYNGCPPPPPWENPNIKLLDDDYWTPPCTTDPPVDTSKYRYFSFRLKVDRAPDISYGGIARVIWTDFLAENRGVSNDIPLHAGWNEVSIDLWDPNVLDDTDPGQSPWQASAYRRNVRLDPFEIPVATTFHVDWIKLTAENEPHPQCGYDIRWEVHDPDSEDVAINIWYGTKGSDAAGTSADHKTLIAKIQPNGQVISPSKSSPIPDFPGQTGEYKVYLPLVCRDCVSCSPCADDCFRWDPPASVPAGTYYIYIEADDGYNTTTWCSEVPVVIKP